MLEANGVRVAAISYDSQEALSRFAERHSISFPLLSDRGSAVIRSFGIFNRNIAPDLRAHGVPHPVNYLIAPGGVIARKYFVPNYQHRVTAAAVALREFGTANSKDVTLRRGALEVTIRLSSEQAFAGQELSYLAKFALDSGWHVYGAAVNANYEPTSLVFDSANIVEQSCELPPPEWIELKALGEMLPIYSGEFQATGRLPLKFPMESGITALRGKLRFQLCSETVCEPPEAVELELPLKIEPFLVAEAAPKR
jgi:hypothetical protein